MLFYVIFNALFIGDTQTYMFLYKNYIFLIFYDSFSYISYFLCYIIVILFYTFISLRDFLSSFSSHKRYIYTLLIIKIHRKHK